MINIVSLSGGKDSTYIVKPEISLHLVERYNGMVEKIRNISMNSTDLYIKIGFNLWLCKKESWYKGGGYDDVYEMALNEFGWEKSYIRKIINVSKRFSISKRGDVASEFDDVIPTEHIQKKYMDYDFTKLVELLTLTDEQIQEAGITSKWTVKQIREHIKSVKMPSDEEQPEQQEFDEEVEYIKPVPSKRKEIEIKRFEEFAMPAVLGYIEKHMKDGYTVKMIFEKVD